MKDSERPFKNLECRPLPTWAKRIVIRGLMNISTCIRELGQQCAGVGI